MSKQIITAIIIIGIALLIPLISYRPSLEYNSSTSYSSPREYGSSEIEERKAKAVALQQKREKQRKRQIQFKKQQKIKQLREQQETIIKRDDSYLYYRVLNAYITDKLKNSWSEQAPDGIFL